MSFEEFWGGIQAQAALLVQMTAPDSWFQDYLRAVRPIASHPADSAVLDHIKD